MIGGIYHERFHEFIGENRSIGRVGSSTDVHRADIAFCETEDTASAVCFAPIPQSVRFGEAGIHCTVLPRVTVIFEPIVLNEIIVFGIAGAECQVTFVDTDASDTCIPVGEIDLFVVYPTVERIVEGGVADVGENGFHTAPVFGYRCNFSVTPGSIFIVDIRELCTAVEHE